VLCDLSGARLKRNYITHNRIKAKSVVGGGIAAMGRNSFLPYIILEENNITDNCIESDGMMGWWNCGGGAELMGASARIIGNLFERDTNIAASGSEGGGLEITRFSGWSPLPSGHVQGNIFRANITNSDNSGSFGAGMSIIWTDESIIRDNLFEGNKSTCSHTAGWAQGGGIVIDDEGITDYGRKTVLNNKFINNSVHSEQGSLYVNGAGMIIYQTTATLVGNEVFGNVASLEDTSGTATGGGCCIWGVSFHMENNLIFKNIAADNGGGLDIIGNPVYGSEQFIVNNTIFDNHADVSGGGLSVTANADVTSLNNILWANTAPANQDFYVGDAILNMYHSLVQDPVKANISNGVFCADPLFADTLGHLSEQSPAVGRGVSSLDIDDTTYQVPSVDFEGNPRPSVVDPLVDIGAYESDYGVGEAYPSSFTLSDRFILPNTGILRCLTEIVNYHQQNIQLFSKFYNSDSSIQDSVEMFDDGQHADGTAGDGLYAGSYQTDLEEMFTTSLVLQNNSNLSRTVYGSKNKFTSVGPVKLAYYEITSTDTIPNPGDVIKLNYYLTNLGATVTAKDISIRLRIADTLAAVSSTPIKFGDIAPGSTVAGKIQRYIALSMNFTGPIDYLPILLEIASNDYVFWYDSIKMVVGINGTSTNVPMVYDLKQNYPNPFNPNTNIEFTLPRPEWVTLKVFNVLGQQVASIVSEKLNSGIHKYEWQAQNLPSGIYYCRMQAGEFTDTKKMVLLK
jgi:hypothetical protein